MNKIGIFTAMLVGGALAMHGSADPFDRLVLRLKSPLIRSRATLSWPEFNHIITTFKTVMLSELSAANRWINPLAASQWNLGLWAQEFNPYVMRLTVTPGTHLALWGDMHGSHASLIMSLDTLRGRGYLDDTFHIVDPNFYCVFLGDLVDRGPESVEVIALVMLLKINNPNNVIIVRGNHEDGALNERYGFGEELRAKYHLDDDQIDGVYQLYDLLPLALYISSGTHDAYCSVLCCHGGFEPGFSPYRLLNAPSSIAFETIGTLNRLQEVMHMPSALKKTVIQLFGAPRASKMESGGYPNELASCKPISMTMPYTLGFAWHDFIDDNSHTIVGYRLGRGWMYGKQLTNYLLAAHSSSHNRLIGVFRAHQHNGPMLDQLKKGRGISSLWGKLVYTIVSGFHAAGPEVNGTFALLVTGAYANDWHVYHGGANFIEL